jgi:hypothetical protein
MVDDLFGDSRRQPNYWVVGAAYGHGNEPMDEEWVECGYWELGYEDGPQVERARQMKAGDRIAIKRNTGGRNPTGAIRILHLGIIKRMHTDDGIWCSVNWVVTDLNRTVENGRGCYASVHGPFPVDDWVREVFCL